MKTFVHSFLIFLSLSIHLTPPCQSQTLGDVSELPFSIEIEEVTHPSIPGLHSFAFGQIENWWVIVGGRMNGLHGFFIATGFPEDQANTAVRLIHPSTGTVHSFGVEEMGLPFLDALRATNPQYAQDGDNLYITGGYGKDEESGLFRTFPVLTAVDLDLLKTKLLNGENPEEAFRQTEISEMQVCGGEMEKLGDHFYLVGGHDFAGLYNQTGPPQFTQTYINEVRRFKITDTPSELSIADYSIFHDEENLHRRDFTLAPVIQSDGTEGLCLYGGVFRPDEDLPYYNPVYISEDGTAAVDTAVEQLFSQYTCPAVPIYDSLDGSVYTLFFAGLSAHFIENGAVEYDERVPFIKDISVFQRRADGSSAEYVLPQRFDEFLGTNMIYVPAADSPQFGHGILHLQAMDEPTFVGYLYGGIKAEIPNFTPSVASNRLFKIYLVPKAVAAAEEVAAAPPALQVFPNPFSNGSALEFRHFLPVQRVDLLRPDGQMLNTFDQPSDNGFMFLNNYLEGLPAGLYFLNVVAGERMSVVKLVKQ